MLTIGCASMAQGAKRKQLNPTISANKLEKQLRLRQKQQSKKYAPLVLEVLNDITSLKSVRRRLPKKTITPFVRQNKKPSSRLPQVIDKKPKTLLQRRQDDRCKPLNIITMPIKDQLFGAPNPLTGRPNQKQTRKYVQEILGTQYVTLDNLKKRERFLYDQCILSPQEITSDTLIQHIKYYYQDKIDQRNSRKGSSKGRKADVSELKEKYDKVCKDINNRLKTKPLSRVYLEKHESDLYSLYTKTSPGQNNIAIDNLIKRLEKHYKAKIKPFSLLSFNPLMYKLTKVILKDAYDQATGKNDRIQALDEYLRTIQNYWINLSKNKAPQYILDFDHQYIQNVLRTEYITLENLEKLEPTSYMQLVESAESDKVGEAILKIDSYIYQKYTKHIHPSKVNHNSNRRQNAVNCFIDDLKDTDNKINRIQILGRLIHDLQDHWINVSKHKMSPIIRPSKEDAREYVRKTFGIPYITLDELKSSSLYKKCIESKTPHNTLRKIEHKLNELYTPHIDQIKWKLNQANYKAIKTRVYNNFFFNPYDTKAKAVAREQAVDGYIQDIQNHWIAVSKCRTPRNTTKSYL